MPFRFGGRFDLGPSIIPIAPSVLVEDFENIATGFAYGTSSGSGSIAADTTNKNSGTQSLAIINGAAGAATLYADQTLRGLIGQTLSAGEVLTFWNYVQTSAGINAITIEITVGGTTCIKSTNFAQSGLATGFVQQLAVATSEFTNAASLTSGPITKIRYRANFNASALAGDRVCFDTLRRSAKGRPKIAFAFDLGYASHYLAAKPYLDQYGFKASVYLTSSFVGTNTAASDPYLTAAQVQALFAGGWDIANHTKSDVDMSSYTTAQVQTEYQQCQTYIQGLGCSGAEFQGSCPLGKTNSTAIIPGQVAAGMLMQRGSFDGDIVYKDQLVQPQLVGGLSCNTGVTTATATAVVDTTLLRGTGHIFWSHGLAPDSSSQGIGWNLPAWRPLVDYVAAKQQAGLCDVVTLSQLYAARGS